jgi:hypothetical protein
LFRESGSNMVYVVQGGTKYWVPSEQEFYSLGYRWDRVEMVPPGSLSFLRDRPPDKTLVRERDNNYVWYIENGQKRWISSPEVLEKMGFSFGDVKIVPSGALKREATASPLQ